MEFVRLKKIIGQKGLEFASIKFLKIKKSFSKFRSPVSGIKNNFQQIIVG